MTDSMADFRRLATEVFDEYPVSTRQNAIYLDRFMHIRRGEAAELSRLREENERLRAALKPFAACVRDLGTGELHAAWHDLGSAPFYEAYRALTSDAPAPHTDTSRSGTPPRA